MRPERTVAWVGKTEAVAPPGACRIHRGGTADDRRRDEAGPRFWRGALARASSDLIAFVMCEVWLSFLLQRQVGVSPYSLGFLPS